MTDSFVAVLKMSLTGSYVALAVILMRVLLKKAPKVFSYALWALVLFRLICPLSFESSISVLPDRSDIIAYESTYTHEINPGVGITENPINRTIPGASVPGSNSETSRDPVGSLIQTGSVIWVTGMAALISYAAFSYFRLKYRLSTATLLDEGIYETDLILTPFVLGFIWPRIYVPTGLSKKEMDYIKKHEKIHIRRLDHIVKPIAFFALALHWFNPLVWISYTFMIKDMEMSCDEAVLGRSGKDIREAYSGSLLSLSARQSGLLVPLAFGETNAKERIMNVLNYRKPALWVLIVSIVIIAIASVTLLTNPAKADERNVTNLVEKFGDNLSQVSLLAPKDILANSIRDNYGEYVSPELLEQWIIRPADAPGRLTSSPWPDSIDILSIEKLADNEYMVKGNIIELTGKDLVDGGYSAKRLVTIKVKRFDGRWLIHRLTMGEYNEETDDIITRYAWEIINRDIDHYESNPEIEIVDSKITRLELVETVDTLTDDPIRIYVLEYRLLPRDLSKVMMAGGMQVDEDGWLKETCSMGSPQIVVTGDDENLQYLGILWTGTVLEVGGLEPALEELLSLIPPADATLSQQITLYLDNHLLTPGFGGTVFSAHEVLDGDDGKIYAWVYGQEYYIEDGVLKKGSGISGPVVVTYDLDSNKARKIVKKELPRDGALFEPDVKAMFPEGLQERILNIHQEQTVNILRSRVEKRAAEWFASQGFEVIVNEYSLIVNGKAITLRDWDYVTDFESILGSPVSETVETLGQGADTFTGSHIKTLEYPGLTLELFSSKDNGTDFWLMNMVLTGSHMCTPRGITVGSSLEELKNAYAAISVFPDGRTDENNCAYIMVEAEYTKALFEVENAFIKEIRMYYELP